MPLRMSTAGGALRFAPKTRLYPAQPYSKIGHEDDRFQFGLKTVIGSTTDSPNGFDFDTARNLFVYCAGPAAILCEVQNDLTISQRLFRARPNTSPINATSSFYNAATPPGTPTRAKNVTPLREGNYAGANGHLETVTEAIGGSKIQNRLREAKCISLSRHGDLLAIGEVS